MIMNKIKIDFQDKKWLKKHVMLLRYSKTNPTRSI